MLVGFSAEYLIGVIAVWFFLVFSLYLFVRFRCWRPNRPRLRRLAPWLLFAWSTAFVAAAAETGFAFAYDQTDSFGLTKVHQRWYKRHVQRNSWRCRDKREYTPKPETGVRRLTILGDSFAFGHGVVHLSDRMGETLQRRLQKEAASGVTWEVYTVADPGADTLFEIKTLGELQARGFATDQLLLVYNLNDIEGLVPELDVDIMGSILCPQPAAWNWPCHQLFLPNFLYYRYVQYSRPEVRDYFGWLKTAYRGQAWELQKERLSEIIEWCRRQNVEMRVAIFPFLHNLDDYAFGTAHTELAAYFRSRNVPCLDLLPTMKDHSAEGLIVNRYDAHPNERAHALAAEAIYLAFYTKRN